MSVPGGFCAAGLVLASLASLATPVAAEQLGSPPTSANLCVEAQVAGEPVTGSRLDCLNAELARQARDGQGKQRLLELAVRQSLPTAPTELGLYNQTATRFRLGTGFGHSVYPQRPVPVFRNSLPRGH